MPAPAQTDAPATAVSHMAAGLQAWENGDLLYAPYVLLAWRAFTGYGNPWWCAELADWKGNVVDQMRYEAWRNRWENGFRLDPEIPIDSDYTYVWYAETPVGQISFHIHWFDVPEDYIVPRTRWADNDDPEPYWVCLKPHCCEWDGEVGVVAERLAEYYGIDLPADADDGDAWREAVRQCGLVVLDRWL